VRIERWGRCRLALPGATGRYRVLQARLDGPARWPIPMNLRVSAVLCGRMQGFKPERTAIHMTKLADWSRQVRERDGRCMDCGSVEDLHAHHIKPKSTHPDLKLDVANGKTLCYRCHKQEHERARSTRIRAKAPHRKTMLKRIAELELQVKALTEALHRATKRGDRFPNPWPQA
jgi:hypothetical protein